MDMEELQTKSNIINPRWYSTDQSQSLNSDTNRWRNGMRAHIWRPATDVYETEDTVVVRVEIAGMKEEDFSISLTGRLLTVRGNRPDILERRAYHQMEIFFGEFSTEVELPAPVLSENVTAEYIAGFLRLVFLKDRPKKIHINE
jgi:HSP20 family protein